MPADRTLVVLGCGSIGKRHMRNLIALDAGRVVGFDPRSDRRAEAHAQTGAETVDSLDAAWKLAPDAAIVAAPTSLHARLALDAAENGCHLFVEKPLSHSRESIDRLLDIVRSRGLVTLVGCNLRFHPVLRRVKALLAEGAVGRVTSARAEFGQHLPDWHPWEDYRTTYSARLALGGGIVLDAIHELDYLRWLLGEVEAVACFCDRLSGLEIDTEDTAAILLRFASGAIGEVSLDYVQREPARGGRIVGEAGTLRWDLRAGEGALYSAAERAWTPFRAPDGWEANDMYVDELRHFLACLDGRETPEQDAREGARVLDIALRAKESSQTRTFQRVIA